MMALARLFAPDVYGLFSVIQVFAIFFVLFGEMGSGPALINEKRVKFMGVLFLFISVS